MIHAYMYEAMHKIISNISINIEQKSYWDIFQSEDIRHVDLNIEINSNVYEYGGIEVFSHMKYPLVFRAENSLVSSNADWSYVDVTLLDGKSDGLDSALSAIVMTHLSTRNGLLMHASFVDYDGKGILFIGPSGIGKTTQAELWAKYKNATIVNGDMALVHYENSKYYGYGCPWHGSSVYCENRKAELYGIIVLEQALENHIERLTGITMVDRVMRNVFLPKWYEEGVNAALRTVDGLLSTVPVYLLKCRIEKQAVELVERVLFKKNV